MIRYLGIFFICTALALLISKKKSDKGKETWESKHNIHIKKWWYVVSFIIGFILTFGSNFYINIHIPTTEENVKVTTPNETKEIDSSQQSDNNNSETIEETSNNISNDNNIPNNNNNAETNVVALTMSDGFLLEITVPNNTMVSSENNVVGITEGNEYYAMYLDSFVPVDDEKEIIEYFKNVNIEESDITVYSISNEKIYVGDYVNSLGTHKEYVLQDIGAKNYLAIELTDYESTLNQQELLEKFVIALNN